MNNLKEWVLNVFNKIEISMPYLSDEVKWIIGIIGGLASTLTGGLDGLMYALLVFIVIDYISGLSVARARHEMNSEIGWLGITKKFQTLLMVIVGNILDTKVIGQGSVFRTAIIFLYISNECISIMENTANLGLPVPKRVVEWLVQVKNAELYKPDEESEVKKDGHIEENHTEVNTE